MSIQVIPTHYNGITYRSRTEARWAVYFDCLRLNHDYEKEGYDLDGEWYLPDFNVENMIVEIKGQEPTLHEKTKARNLGQYLKKAIIILIGSPHFLSKHLIFIPPPDQSNTEDDFNPNSHGWGWHYFYFIDDNGVCINVLSHRNGAYKIKFNRGNTPLHEALSAAKNERFGVHNAAD